MTNRERALAALNYEPYDRLPVVHFGYWHETLDKWAEEGHISRKTAKGWGDGNEFCRSLDEKLGFDFNWGTIAGGHTDLRPGFAREVIKDFGDGRRHVRNGSGVVELERDGAVSIAQEIEHLLVDRESWEEHYLPRLQPDPERVPKKQLLQLRREFEAGKAREDKPRGIWAGSFYGKFRDWAGVTGTSYIYADDEDLYAEIIDTIANLAYHTLEEGLSHCVPGMFDFAHFWEDICFKNGPLVIPSVFEELVGPHYKRITTLLRQYDIHIASLDCDGCIDALLPIWLKNGINTMFPIEVGTWEASIAPWRAQYGKELRGVGGMNKNVFAEDFAAVDAEIERLRPLIALGGYIPCPDHRIPPGAKWENVCYYTKRMREEF